MIFVVNASDRDREYLGENHEEKQPDRKQATHIFL